MKNTAKKIQTMFDLDPTTIICLYKINLKEKGSYLFHAGQNGYHKKIVFDGQQYDYFPIKAEGFEIQGDGRLPRPVLTFSNHQGVISLRLKEFNDFINHKVTRVKTFVKYLDNINFPDNVNPFAEPDPEASFEEDVFYVNRKTREDDNIVAFELVSPLELQNANIPARRIYANACPWMYRGAIGCGYNGKPISDSKNKRYVASGYYPRVNIFGNMQDISMVGSEVYFTDFSDEGTHITHVAGGGEFALFLNSSGNCFSCGDNMWGALGLGDTVDRSLPSFVSGEIKDMVGSFNGHTLFLLDNGDAYGCGYNRYGQLGLGNNGVGTDRLEPTRITGNVEAVAAGAYHSMFLARDGAVYTCGRNTLPGAGGGQLGLGDLIDRDLPTLATGNVTGIAAGNGHSMFLAQDRQVYSCGSNAFGQLGLGDTNSRNLPIPVTGSVVKMEGGAYFSLFLDTNGYAYSCGDNRFGQLSLGDNGVGTERLEPTLITNFLNLTGIGAQANASMFLDANNDSYSCGDNQFGQLGLGDTVDRSIPEFVTGNITEVAAGGFFSLLLDTNGDCYSCGYNSEGQLGLGDTINREWPTYVSGRTVIGDSEFARFNSSRAYDEWAATGVYQEKDVVQITPFDHDSDLNPVDVYVCIRDNTQSNPVYNREDWVLDECSKSLCGCRLRFSNAATGAGGATRVIETRVSADEFWTEEEEGLPFGGFPGTDPYNFK